MQVVCLGYMVRYWAIYKQNEEEGIQDDGEWNSPRNCIYYSAAGLCITTFFNVLFYHPYFMEMYKLGMRIRIACCHLIYKKVLRLSQAALRHATVGQIVNLLSNDVLRFDACFVFTHCIVGGPVHAIIATTLIWFYLEIKVPSLIGLAILVLYVPFQSKNIFSPTQY